MEEDIALAFEVLKCAGKYGVPYLYIQCRQWIVEHFDHFEDYKNVKVCALLYLEMVNTNRFLWDRIGFFNWMVSGTESRVRGPENTGSTME